MQITITNARFVEERFTTKGEAVLLFEDRSGASGSVIVAPNLEYERKEIDEN